MRVAAMGAEHPTACNTARKMKSAINYSLTKETRRGKKGRRKACEEGILNTN